MSQQRFFTNQQHKLSYLLAEAGLTDAALHEATINDPILLNARDIDVVECEGLPAIIFCRSHWRAAGYERRTIINKSHELSHFPLVRVLCALPQHDSRYACEAELSYDEKTHAATLSITRFLERADIPHNTNVSLDSLKHVEHELREPENPPLETKGELVCAE